MDGWIRGRKETGKQPNLFSLLLHQFCCALFAFIFLFFSDSFLLIWPRRRKTTIHSIRAADTRTRCKMDGRGRCGIWSLCFPFCHKSNWASCESASAIKASLGSCPLYDKTDESFFLFLLPHFSNYIVPLDGHFLLTIYLRGRLLFFRLMGCSSLLLRRVRRIWLFFWIKCCL